MTFALRFIASEDIYGKTLFLGNHGIFTYMEYTAFAATPEGQNMVKLSPIVKPVTQKELEEMYPREP